MKSLLAVGTAAGALALAACSNSANATVSYTSHSGSDGRHVFDQDGDVSLMGSDMDISGRIGGDLSLIGSDLTISADVDGDMSLVGSDVEFDGSVGGEASIAGSDVDWRGAAERDVDIAGSDVNWSGSTGGSLSIAGSDVTIAGTVASDLDVAGSDIVIESSSRIDGDTSLAGSDLELFGTLNGDASLAGSSLHLTGAVNGRLIASLYPGSRWGRRWGGDNNGLARIDGAVGESSAICALRVEIGENANISGTMAVFADEAPVYDNRRTEANISYEALNGRECNDVLEPYDR
ncbi:hypothetical protein [Hyphobacterium sp.]|uniref:hypothetical protein n=1 Tax=Hyphobacterium sp. TaxID=2004662 RepID=UPI003BAC0971